MVRVRENNFYALKPVMDKNPHILDLRVGHMDIFSNFAVPLIFKSRESFERYRIAFEKAGVEIRPIIAGNMLHQPFYKKHVLGVGKCENADYIHRCGFYFGNNPELTASEISLLKKLLAN